MTIDYSTFLHAQVIKSPNGNLVLNFELTSKGTPSYRLSYKQKPVIKASTLGIEAKDVASFIDGFTITKTEQASVNDTWNPIMGEQKTIRNNYNELLITLIQKAHKDRFILIRFKLFNDGLGFRYEFPKQENLKYFTIKEEHTQFNLAGDHKTFWIPGDYDTK